MFWILAYHKTCKSWCLFPTCSFVYFTQWGWLCWVRRILFNINSYVSKYDFAPPANRANCPGRTGLKLNIPFINRRTRWCFPKDIPLSIMRTDDRAGLAVPTDEYPTPDSKILAGNSMGLSKDVEMRSLFLSQQNTFHFPV